MGLTRWNPLLDLRSMENEMNRMLRRSRPWLIGSEEGLATTAFAPPVDIYEDDNKLTLKLQAPGIDPNDLDVHVEGNTLSISGERKFEREEKEENFRRIESQYGSFCRTFSLPASADTDKINADFHNGVLKIDVPKRAESKGKQIKIGGAKTPQEKKAA
jgi:HSP20 family protein